jgi:glyoxylase-like metal-dependent hydrolase (beta-lactamase superfamily II)
MKINVFVSRTMGQNCYAVSCSDGVFLIDPGEYAPELERFLIENGPRVKYILLTHCHFDHIGYLEEASRLCPEGKIVISKEEQTALNDPDINLSLMFGCENVTKKADLTVSDGTSLPFEGKEIKVISTPGHTEGSVCYLFEDNLFSGDTLFKESYGRTDLPTGDANKLFSSLKKLSLLDEKIAVYPGHGESTTIRYENQYNPVMREFNF